MGGSALHGRAAELHTLRSAAQSVTDRGASLALVRGEAGVGKSAVIGHLVGVLSESGWVTMRAALSEFESQLSWAGLRLLCSTVTPEEFDELPEGVRRAIPIALGMVEGEEIDEARVAFAFADLIRRRAPLRPVALVIDDLHWLDPASARAVAFAIRSNPDGQLFALVGHRPVDLPIDLDRLLPAHQITHVDLAGLAASAISHLLIDAVGLTLSRPDILRIHATTGGHPLHAIEIARLVTRGLSLDDALVHPSAYEIIAEQVDLLPPGASDVLLAAALVARPTPRRLAAALPDLDIRAELDVATKLHLAELRDGAIAFSHPLVRAAVIARTGRTRRRRFQIALAEKCDDADERVMLLVSSHEGTDAKLAAELDSAVERAASRGDLPVAITLARHAIELTPPDSTADAVERALRAANCAMSAGDNYAPIEFADRAVALDPSVETRFRAGIITMLAIGNRPDDAGCVAAGERLLDQLDDDPARRAKVFDILAQGRLRTTVSGAIESAQQAMAEALRSGDPAIIQRETALLASMRAHAGEFVDLDEAERQAELMADDNVAKDWWVTTLGWCDRHEFSIRHSLQQLAAYRRLGLVHFEMPVYTRLLMSMTRTGQYAAAIEYAQAWLDLHAMVGGISPAAVSSEMSVVMALQGRVEEAAEWQRRVESAHATPVEELESNSLGCFVALILGDWEAAVERGRRARTIASEIGCAAVAAAPFRMDLVEALLQLGEVVEATLVAEELEYLAERSRLPRAKVETLRCRALIEAAGGRLDRSIVLGRAAVEAYELLELPLDLARARLVLGSTLRRDGRAR